MEGLSALGAAAVFAAYLHGAPPPGEHTRGLYYKTLL